MKPNKQRIHSSQPVKPGSASKLQYLNRLNSNKSRIRNKLPDRTSAFELASIVSNFKLQESPNPFKVLSFPSPTSKEKLKKRNFHPASPLARKIGRYSNLNFSGENVKTVISESAKDEELCNNTIDTMKNKHESLDEFFGIFPNKYWCSKCGKDVMSRVKMNLPTLSVWNRICCSSCVVPVDKFQEILHFCPGCGVVLERVEPVAL